MCVEGLCASIPSKRTGNSKRSKANAREFQKEMCKEMQGEANMKGVPCNHGAS